MDTTQLLSVLSDQSNKPFDYKMGKDLELLAAKYPYFAAVHFANFAVNQEQTSTAIAKAATPNSMAKRNLPERPLVFFFETFK